MGKTKWPVVVRLQTIAYRLGEEKFAVEAAEFKNMLGFDTETGEGPTILIKSDGLSEMALQQKRCLEPYI
jgi:hypothetical protein